MTNHTSQKIYFLQLLNMYSVAVPIIQRDYAQGRTGQEELRRNFLKALKLGMESNGLELDFVYGSISDNVLYPLDGQQRLTTLFLLHWYLAVREDKLNDDIKQLLIKFSYETRISSRDFCQELLEKGITWKQNIKPSELIIDQPWFFRNWKKDPTIKSMLNMLDDIHNEFNGDKKWWSDLDKISFQFIELQNFGLSDDLYIKMNARGKALTDFENFKAKFEQIISVNNWENELDVTQTFIHKIDTSWLDLFWSYRNVSKEKGISIDESMLNFFRTISRIHHGLYGDTKNENFGQCIELLENKKLTISFNQYIDLNIFNESYFTFIKGILNKLSGDQCLHIYLSDTNYIDEKKLFEGATENSLSRIELIRLYAYYQYLVLEPEVDQKRLSDWMRLVRNLLEGTRHHGFNTSLDFAHALNSIRSLLDHRNTIIEYMAEFEGKTLSGFAGEQVREEILKAKLILESEEWRDAIIEIENNHYFKGQIGFLLDWSTQNEVPNLALFKEYVLKSKSVFGDHGLKEFDDFLFERALLTIGDYMLRKSQNSSLLVNDDYSISWKRLLRDNANGKRDFLKALFDRIEPDTIKEDLQKMVDEFSKQEDWRYHFIKEPEIINAILPSKYVRWINEKNILLLKTYKTSGYHTEYYIFALRQKLKQVNLQAEVQEHLWKRSVHYPKNIIINKKYNCQFRDGQYQVEVLPTNEVVNKFTLDETYNFLVENS